MKKILYIFSALLLFSSCELETSNNGDLDGYWHLERVDTLSTFGSLDLSEEKLFWAFQKDLLQLRGDKQEFYLRFNHHDDQLDLSDPHLKDREKDDPAISSSTMYLILPYGINAEQEYFQVVTLNSDDMVLRNQDLQLWFRKF
jgi:hypothetical protein